jgi:hypothetical protein
VITKTEYKKQINRKTRTEKCKRGDTRKVEEMNNQKQGNETKSERG